MAWILSPREKRALLILLQHSTCSTFQIAHGLGYGTAPTREGVPRSAYVYTHLMLSRLRDVGAAAHFNKRWEITEKGRIVAALVMTKEPRLRRIAA